MGLSYNSYYFKKIIANGAAVPAGIKLSILKSSRN